MKFILSAMVGATLAFSAIEADAQATPGERQISLTIESTSLATALDKWAQQSGFQIFVQDWEDTKRLTAPSLKGTFSAQAALEQLLKGTQLTYVWLNDRAVSIRKRVPPTVPAALQSSGALELPEVPRLQLANLAAGEERGEGAEDARAARRSNGPETAGGNVEDLEGVVVTGTYIRGAPNAPGHLIVISRDDIDRSGFGNLSQLIASIPQNFGGDASPTVTSNFNRGSSVYNQGAGTGINLRGLGAGATLTLLNGNRLSPSGQGTFVDVSLIPLSAIDHIEVFTDGASAVYGSDAIGGVVNIITRRNYDGIQSSARIGSGGDGRNEYMVGQLFGRSSDDANVTLNFEHTHEDALTANDRPSLISDDSSPYDLMPEQTSDSLLASTRFSASPSVDLFGDLLATVRRFDQRMSPLSNPPDADGRSTGGGLAVGMTVAVPGDWRIDLIGNYSRNKLDRTVHTPASEFGDASIDTFKEAFESWSGEARATGELFRMPGGPVRAAAGVLVRSEDSQVDFSVGSTSNYVADRKVHSVYGELAVPIFGSEDLGDGRQRLDLSVAARYDSYDDFGGTTNPRVAVVWRRSAALTARAAYSESFRAPLFFQTLAGDGSRGAYVFDVPDPSSARADGLSTTVTYVGANPDLHPETARSFTGGIDFHPGNQLNASLNYFDIKYKDRIVDLQSIDPIGFLINEASFRSAVTRDPSNTLLTALLTPLTAVPNGINDFNAGQFGITDVSALLAQYSIAALFDARFHNSADSEIRGLDFSVRSHIRRETGSVILGLEASYLLEYSTQITNGTPSTDLLNTAFHPIDLRLRASMGWTGARWDTTIFLNYADDYTDRGSAYSLGGDVSSWVTVDGQLRYEFRQGSRSTSDGLTASLSIVNAFDKEPPRINALPGQFAFDPENASPLGRFIALGLTKRW